MSACRRFACCTEFCRHECHVGTFSIDAIGDPNPQVQHAGVLALFEFDGAVPEKVIAGPAQHRHLSATGRDAAAGGKGLIRRARLQLCRSDDTGRADGGHAGLRLLGLPSLRRWANCGGSAAGRGPRAGRAIRGRDRRLRSSAASATTLPPTIGSAASTARNKNCSSPAPATMLADATNQVRLQAAHYLSLLNDPRSEPRVARIRADSDERRLTVAPIVGIGHLDVRSLRRRWPRI